MPCVIMAAMKAGVITFLGSNCDDDALYALTDVLKADTRRLYYDETSLPELDLVVLPGGFSYGDYLRCGAIARFSPIMPAVKEFAETGGIVMGICNGFQILTEAQMLPGALIRNECVQFRCKWVHIRVENANTPFTYGLAEGEVLRIPIAHAEGNYIDSLENIAALKASNSVVFRYCNELGETTPEVESQRRDGQHRGHRQCARKHPWDDAPPRACMRESAWQRRWDEDSRRSCRLSPQPRGQLTPSPLPLW